MNNRSQTHRHSLYSVIVQPLLFISYSLPRLAVCSTLEIIYASEKPLLSSVLYLSCFIILLLMLLLHLFPYRTKNSISHPEFLSGQLLYLCAFSRCWPSSIFSSYTLKSPFSVVLICNGVWMQYNVTVGLG